MKIEVTKSNEKYDLKIDGDLVLTHNRLSTIVQKIEQYLKMRYLPVVDKGGISGALDKLWSGSE